MFSMVNKLFDLAPVKSSVPDVKKEELNKLTRTFLEQQAKNNELKNKNDIISKEGSSACSQCCAECDMPCNINKPPASPITPLSAQRVNDMEEERIVHEMVDTLIMVDLVNVPLDRDSAFDLPEFVEVPVIAKAPVIEVPVVAEVPVAEVPVAEVPVLEIPLVEIPLVEVPVAEVPVVEEVPVFNFNFTNEESNVVDDVVNELMNRLDTDSATDSISGSIEYDFKDEGELPYNDMD